MIYDPAEHPFSETHKLMIGSIVPRPIALVSTTSKDGINNLAPFSYFNGVCSKPPTIMFAPARRGWDGKEKDTLINIRDTKEFSINIVSEAIAEKMVICSTDFEKEIAVYYIGILPDLFSEGQGVVVEGNLINENKFNARIVLAKHDENYMPPELDNIAKPTD